MARMPEAAGNATFVAEFVASSYARAVSIAAGYKDRLFAGGGITYSEQYAIVPAPEGQFLFRYTLSTLQP